MADHPNHGPQTSTVRATREASEVGKLCLLIIGEGIYATPLLPESGTVLIGRQPGCDIVIDHLSISRRHAQLLAACGVRRCLVRGGLCSRRRR